MPAVSALEVVTPRALGEALEFLAAHESEGWQPVAGGTDVMVGIAHGKERRRRWLDVSRLAHELGGIREESDGRVRVGGLATMTALRRSVLLRDACPMIGEAAATVGAVQIQNRATVAGNVVNASPAGDTLPVWLALDAEVELASVRGVRRVPYRRFTPSYRTVERRANELVTAMLFAPLPRARTALLFRKVGTRSAQAISKVVFAGVRRTDEAGRLVDVRLAFGSMAPVPVRAATAEGAATGRPLSRETGLAAAARLSESLAPIDDVRSTAAYRQRVAENLVREFLAGRLGE
ncbi:MAG: FAD binding domain-containing protein [bacterium]